MTPNVKLFIEEQIHLFEQQEWQQLFDTWYIEYSSSSVENDKKQLDELFEIFFIAGIDIAKESKFAREALIVKYMDNYVKNNQAIGKEYVTWAGAVNALLSRLNIGLIELRKLFISVCESEGLHSTSDDKLRYKL